MTALDIGCGDGALARKLADRGLQVLALDVDEGEVRTTREHCAGTDVEVRHGDFLQAGLPSDSYDVVAGLASLHHMPFEQALIEAARVVKPGGRLSVRPAAAGVEGQAPSALALLRRVGQAPSSCRQSTVMLGRAISSAMPSLR